MDYGVINPEENKGKASAPERKMVRKPQILRESRKGRATHARGRKVDGILSLLALLQTQQRSPADSGPEVLLQCGRPAPHSSRLPGPGKWRREGKRCPRSGEVFGGQPRRAGARLRRRGQAATQRTVYTPDRPSVPGCKGKPTSPSPCPMVGRKVRRDNAAACPASTFSPGGAGPGGQSLY